MPSLQEVFNRIQDSKKKKRDLNKAFKDGLLNSQQYQEVVRAKSDAILISPAFGLEHTRSPRAVEKRRRFAELRAKNKTAQLTQDEKDEWKQLELWSED